MVVPRVCSPGMARTTSGERPCRPVPRTSSRPRATFSENTAEECPGFSSPGVFQVLANITRRPVKSGHRILGINARGTLSRPSSRRTCKSKEEMPIRGKHVEALRCTTNSRFETSESLTTTVPEVKQADMSKHETSKRLSSDRKEANHQQMVCTCYTPVRIYAES